MHTVIYKDGRRGTITDEQAEKIRLFRIQGMLNTRQENWLSTVEEIVTIRNQPNQHTLALTKDEVCRCSKCSP